MISGVNYPKFAFVFRLENYCNSARWYKAYWVIRSWWTYEQDCWFYIITWYIHKIYCNCSYYIYIYTHFIYTHYIHYTRYLQYIHFLHYTLYTLFTLYTIFTLFTLYTNYCSIIYKLYNYIYWNIRYIYIYIKNIMFTRFYLYIYTLFTHMYVYI